MFDIDMHAWLSACGRWRETRGKRGKSRVAHVLIAMLAACIVPASADAALAVVGTRFVYPGDARTLTITARNLGDAPILVQTWLDDGDASADPSLLRVPFVVAPPIARVDPRQPLAISVRSIGDELATDRESRFWINLLEVPSIKEMAGNALRIAYRLRMKLLYRPAGLNGGQADASNQLRWTLTDAPQRKSLVIANPTPYYVTLTRLLLSGNAVPIPGGALDVAPFARVDIALNAPGGAASGEIVFDAVGDDGTSREHRTSLQPP
ncbi:fimbrial biogenesis chaperone [Burkholderia ambifaria]|uniref:fimbrial biogenesis chaperone n=1 Tax=Burkholderia ambifaria TaxID=152480 RepID=UPI001FC83C54|nr:fimbria/pilus periplasmic chaperone [Burkholderia ambifaria]WDR88484.1 fimbria/pilus periplasmic chaperone [Burkholderia ambifaria]WDS01237.1 fimbria/pilus periplasmic chaperone [Burkholderia ambifaria]